MTAVRTLADRYLAEVVALDPVRATFLGMPGHDHELTDYSPDGVTARNELARRALVELDGTPVEDEGDRFCAALLRDRLGSELALHEAGEHLRPLRIIGSPVGSLRAAFDLMPRTTADDWDVVARRMRALPGALDQLWEALAAGIEADVVAARRQALAVADQVATWAGRRGTTPWFEQLAGSAPDVGRVDAALAAELAAAARAATAALVTHHERLVTTYAPAAGDEDPVGSDRYLLYAGAVLGMPLDPAAAYAWAWDELARIEAEMAVVAERILPGATFGEAMEHLDTRGEAIEGEDALRQWLQDLMDTTIAELDGTHFDLAPEVRVVEAMIAPPGTAAAQYYTPPSADFSRPGRTWYPTLGATRFPLWGEVSTCYHEGVPGHHLQLAQWRHVAGDLSLYQTSVSISGNVEGWALYAERLMDELGYLDDPDRRLGYLVAQQMRATRVIVDIGMHCRMTIPAGQPFHPGEVMSPELGREFLLAHAGKPGPFLESEWVRYLGWPAQAICYKLGEQVWLAGRDEARRAQGAAFDPKRWHMAALSQGSLPLVDLAAELPRLGAPSAM
jgi:uncharacterized protein (DUF885 family)